MLPELLTLDPKRKGLKLQILSPQALNHEPSTPFLLMPEWRSLKVRPLGLRSVQLDVFVWNCCCDFYDCYYDCYCC